VTCESGAEALRLLAEGEYDLFLCDVAMPGMDGFETTRRLREAAASGALRKAPYVAGVSAHALPEYEARAREAGMDDYVAKPVTLDGLRGLIARAV
jgi:CheY-like chemotaxis protein